MKFNIEMHDGRAVLGEDEHEKLLSKGDCGDRLFALMGKIRGQLPKEAFFELEHLILGYAIDGVDNAFAYGYTAGRR